MTESSSQPFPWQHVQWQHLQQQREAGQLPHALLLAGPPAVGKRQFVRALAALLLCRSPTAAGFACGQCKGCLLLDAGSHPDWHWLAPEETGKAIKIDRVRAVVDFMVQTAQQGGLRLVIIEPAEAMNRSAANALLKTLEEPGAGTLLILVTDAPGRLLPTIRSRCQRLEFPLPVAAEVEDWLRPRVTSATQLAQALDESDGRPLLASALLDGAGFALRNELDQDLVGVLTRQQSVLAVADRWKQRDWLDLLYWLHGRIVKALRARVLAGAANGSSVQLLAAAPAEVLFALLDQLQELLNQTLAGTNPNSQLALESLLFGACDAVDKKT